MNHLFVKHTEAGKKVNKEQSIHVITAMQQATFNAACTTIIHNIEFIDKYSGNKAFDPWEALGHHFQADAELYEVFKQHATKIVLPDDNLSLSHVQEVVSVAGKKLQVFADILDDAGNFDQLKFVEYIAGSTDEAIEDLSKLIELAEAATVTQVDMYMIDDTLAEQVGEANYWIVWGKDELHAA